MGKRERTVHWPKDPFVRPLVSLCGNTHLGIRKWGGTYVRHLATRNPRDVTCEKCMDINPLLALAATDL